MQFIEALSHVVLAPFIIALIFLSPFVLLAFVLQRRKKAYRAIADDPFTQLPLRPPGESLRLRIEELTEEFDSQIVSVGLAPVFSVSVYLATSGSLRDVIGLGLLLFVVIFTIFGGRKVVSLAEQLWDYRLGFTGERVVGEELNQLLGRGFKVFHDVPFDGFNIDHVLVGLPGVYCVETKARRKPADMKGFEKATVTFDGEKLVFPKGNWDTDGLEQARRNARSLEKWLTSACGERVVANAILTLPGWFVTRKYVSDVNVLNPDEIKRSFPDRPKHSLSSEQIQRIAHQLTERCRLPKEPRGK